MEAVRDALPMPARSQAIIPPPPGTQGGANAVAENAKRTHLEACFVDRVGSEGRGFLLDADPTQ